jgi:acyl-CoA thioester hydrolase
VRKRRWKEPADRYLEASTVIPVRFQEVDILGMVWHGHYLGFFEAGRADFGRQHGLTYDDMLGAGFVLPVVHASVDYHSPARLGTDVTVRTRLHPEPGAWVQSTYVVTGPGDEELATGRTVQTFTQPDGELLIAPPPFYEEWLARHEDEIRCVEST